MFLVGDAAGYIEPFTGEGMPTRRNVWIEKGVVKALNYDRYWAQQKGVEPAGFGEHEGMLPLPPRMFAGYRLLQELFAGHPFRRRHQRRVEPLDGVGGIVEEGLAVRGEASKAIALMATDWCGVRM